MNSAIEICQYVNDGNQDDSVEDKSTKKTRTDRLSDRKLNVEIIAIPVAIGCTMADAPDELESDPKDKVKAT